jgi:hypothetical protein
LFDTYLPISIDEAAQWKRPSLLRTAETPLDVDLPDDPRFSTSRADRDLCRELTIIRTESLKGFPLRKLSG